MPQESQVRRDQSQYEKEGETLSEKNVLVVSLKFCFSTNSPW